jgi:hypothetical protein
MAERAHYRLFSCEHSYFSGEARALLRFEGHGGALPFEDALATPELISGLSIPPTGTNVVPQLLAAGGVWLQDTSEMADFVEQAHPELRSIPPASAPRQHRAPSLLELLAGFARRAAGRAFVEAAFGIREAETNPRGARIDGALEAALASRAGGSSVKPNHSSPLEKTT